MRRRFNLISRIFLFSVLLLTACDGQPSTTTVNPGTLRIDPYFKSMYQKLGADLLGHPITPAFQENGKIQQYTEKALLVYDPMANANENYSLAQLGLELDYHNLNYEPYTGEGIIIHGFTVPPVFLAAYNLLGGETYVGRPISDPIVNLEKNRLEQHFENLGLYQPLNNPSASVRLLPYGLQSCSQSCREYYIANNIHTESAAPEISSNLREPFLSAVNRIGDDIVGNYLYGPYPASDGHSEIIFENMVLYEDNGRVFARPIVTLLNLPIHPLTTPVDNPYLAFIPKEGDLGHNVPLFIYDYIFAHGGLDVSGFPTTEFHETGNNTYQQCFTNLCLVYFRGASEDSQIQPLELGWRYNEELRSRITSTPVFTPAPEQQNIDPQASGEDEAPPPPAPVSSGPGRIEAWEQEPLIDSQTSQTIYVKVFGPEAPLSGAAVVFTVTIPGKSDMVFHLPATAADGTTHITLPPIKAENGILVMFDACPQGNNHNIPCASGSFMIWGNP